MLSACHLKNDLPVPYQKTDTTMSIIYVASLSMTLTTPARQITGKECDNTTNIFMIQRSDGVNRT